MVSVFFFFQAEGGIRDLTVTGVQTCALPISPSDLRALRGEHRRKATTTSQPTISRAARSRAARRSEERRVGKECRSRWTAQHQIQNHALLHRLPRPTARDTGYSASSSHNGPY